MLTYDYVIVGAGSAGCVLAGRLSEDSGSQVLLVEAGAPDRKQEIHIPAAFAKLFKTPYDWDLHTGKQSELAQRELYWPRGRMLGGSSSINAMMWARGHRADYDAWAELGAEGWSYDDIAAYFRRAERRTGPNDGGVYGTEGPLHIQELRDPNPTTAAFLSACSELGMRRHDINSPDNEGYSQTPVTQRRGRRWSTADAYLKPARKRPNLTVVTGALARKVLIDDELRATGVEYSDSSGRTHQVRARRDVILSGGAIGSPHLLMLSGIGDPEVLRAADIAPRHELPGVGRNLQDHLAIATVTHCTEPVTLAGAESPVQLLRYLLLAKGMLTSNVGEALAFIRTDDALTAPDIELIYAPGPFINHGLEPPPGHGMTVAAILLQPESVGTIVPAGPDPERQPVIDPAYLSASADRATLLAGLRRAVDVLNTDALGRYVGAPMAPWPGDVDDEALGRYISEHSETLYHPVGTCRMGTDDQAVVDPQLRVHGISGLRVVDASVMPRINRGHTHAPTVMIAERAADLIESATP
ncbi:GMC family oxidoreductase [Yinghuangia seranimata]|uniref:GMC family oxidoreductase n=1 Tax=Yinghuangia seranimata TaxID=408067 RepID=UPI00248C1633|nr:GMC family oxidoreductase N-terminal domain-containing protein [Yinghuangia seranimata]MDI2131179.1 GMC family oxidoreductase N-terminal domain-containing protein [Yinghuangia seranimata]